MQQLNNAFVLVFVCLLSASAHAQLGPRPSEIPAEQSASSSAQTLAQVATTPTQPKVDVPSEEASNSAMARPAIDEILLSRARSGDTPSEQPRQREPLPSNERTLEGDMRSRETLPPAAQGQPAGLVGSSVSGPEGGSIASIDKGWVQTIAALGGVLLLILGLSQLYKRLARAQGGLVGQIGAGGSAPSGLVEVIGRYPIGTGMTLVVLKFDRRVLLLASGAATRGKHARGATMHTLCELDDPEDVASVLLKARNADGESIARSFERVLQEADDLTDDSIYANDEPMRGHSSVKFPQKRSEPVRSITNDEGDRAELWSSDMSGRAAAGVLRKRLASMRREQQGA